MHKTFEDLWVVIFIANTNYAIKRENLELNNQTISCQKLEINNI